MTDKPCDTCIYMSPCDSRLLANDPEFYYCNHPKNWVGDKIYRRWKYAESHRAAGWLRARLYKLCGSEGRWYRKEAE